MVKVEYSIQQRDGFESRCLQCADAEEANFVVNAVAREMRRCGLGGFVKTTIGDQQLFVHLDARVVVRMTAKQRKLTLDELVEEGRRDAPDLRIADNEITLEDDAPKA